MPGFLRKPCFRYLLCLAALAPATVAGLRSASATVTVTTTSNTTTLVNALTPGSATGVSITGTPTILGSFASNAYGTFTTSGSNLGMASGAVFGTGNVSQISGAPTFFWDGPGTGVTSGTEFDRAALTFSFIPDPGVTKVAFRYMMGSEEYNEYVGQNFSDNITIRLSGGIYSNTNVAVVPGTSTGIDIDTINATLNSVYYRDNTVATPPVPDSVLDGHTTVLSTISAVVPATTYSAEIKVADFTDNAYNTAIFVNYFGAALLVDLDGDNSSGATASDFLTTFTEAGPAIPVVDTDRLVTNLDTTSVVQATIRLTNAQASDSLTVGTLPGGITSTVDTSVPGVITVTLSGSGSTTTYQTALSAIRFSNSSNVPSTTQRTVTVVLSDGTTNSNTATTRINIVVVPTYLYTVAKTVNLASITAPSTLSYTINLVNTGDGAMTGVTLSDVLSQAAFSTPLSLTGPTGDAGAVGTFDIGETWSYTASYSAGQPRLDSGANILNTVTVSTTETGAATQQATATTTVVQNPQLSVVKSANTAGPVSAGQQIIYSYTVNNTGNITIAGITINDVHNGFGTFPSPAGEVLQTDVNPTGDSADAIANGSWDVLAPGDSVRFTAAYQVVQDDIDNLQ